MIMSLKESIRRFVFEVFRSDTSSKLDAKTRSFIEEFTKKKFFSTPWTSYSKNIDDVDDVFKRAVVETTDRVMGMLGGVIDQRSLKDMKKDVRSVVKSTLDRLFADRLSLPGPKLPKSWVNLIDEVTSQSMEDYEAFRWESAEDIEPIFLVFKHNVIRRIEAELFEKGLYKNEEDWAEMVNSGAIVREIRKIVKREFDRIKKTRL